MVYIFGENNRKTLTVEELIVILQRYDQDEEVFLRTEDGSIFGVSEESVCCSDELIENYASQS